VVGHITFYDQSLAWGIILGADGVLYAVRGAQLSGPPPRVGERVTFDPQPGARGARGPPRQGPP
jgi:hypothetical protein